MMADQGKMLLITTFRDEPEYPDHELQRECHINGLFDLLSLYDREEVEEEEDELPYDEVVYDPENEVFYEIDDFNKESLTKKNFVNWRIRVLKKILKTLVQYVYLNVKKERES